MDAEPCDPAPIVFDDFLAFWKNKMFQTHLVLSLPKSWISHFSKKPWFPSMRSAIWRPQSWLGVGGKQQARREEPSDGAAAELW